MTVAAYRFNNDLRYRDAEHPDNTQFTPGYVLGPVRADLGGVIGLDPCTTHENPVAATRFFTPAEDGLARSWYPASSVYVNPPYAKAREPWVDRCIRVGSFLMTPVILLIPAATDTRVFQRAVETADAVVFIRGRVKFGVLRPNRRQVAASHPSALIGWNTALDACSALGWRCGTTMNAKRSSPEVASLRAALAGGTRPDTSQTDAGDGGFPASSGAAPTETTEEER